MRLIVLCCAGMSSTLMVTYIRECAAEEVVVEAVFGFMPNPLEELDLHEGDVILVAPQASYEYAKVQQYCNSHNCCCEKIDPFDYGTMNGKKVYEDAMKLVEKQMEKQKNKEAK